MIPLPRSRPSRRLLGAGSNPAARDLSAAPCLARSCQAISALSRRLRERLAGGGERVSRASDASPRRPACTRGAPLPSPRRRDTPCVAGERRHRTGVGQCRCGRRGRTGHDWANPPQCDGLPAGSLAHVWRWNGGGGWGRGRRCARVCCDRGRGHWAADTGGLHPSALDQTVPPPGRRAHGKQLRPPAQT